MLLFKAKKYLIARGKLDWAEAPGVMPALRRSETLGERGQELLPWGWVSWGCTVCGGAHGTTWGLGASLRWGARLPLCGGPGVAMVKGLWHWSLEASHSVAWRLCAVLGAACKTWVCLFLAGVC